MKVNINFLIILISFCSYNCSFIFSSENRELFENKKILITGGTGFLGRMIGKEILNYNPDSLIILSRDEHKQSSVLDFFHQDPRVKTILGDTRDYNSLYKHTKNIDLVIHTAALKRIDTIEFNVEESIKTNILGTINLFNACVANNVKKVIFISTDKACSPINTYGACKFISERIFTNYDRTKIKTIFCAVRLGNLLESTGSVIPLFVDKIKKGKDLTLTDSRMTRFIVTKDQAFELVCDTIRYGMGGEIFIKKIASMKITDLIQVLKNRFNANNKIVTVGLRPGERTYELLINHCEIPRTYSFKDNYIITPCLNEWHSSFKGHGLPLYIKEGKKLNEDIMKQYGSDEALINFDELELFFQKFNF